MKIRKGFLLREVAGENIVIGTGEAARTFNAMIHLNKSGAFLWLQMENRDTTKEDLLAAMLEHYDVTEDIASADIDAFLSAMRGAGLLEQ